MKQNGKIKENAGPVDKLISVITYIVFALFSLIHFTIFLSIRSVLTI